MSDDQPNPMGWDKAMGMHDRLLSSRGAATCGRKGHADRADDRTSVYDASDSSSCPQRDRFDHAPLYEREGQALLTLTPLLPIYWYQWY